MTKTALHRRVRFVRATRTVEILQTFASATSRLEQAVRRSETSLELQECVLDMARVRELILARVAEADTELRELLKAFADRLKDAMLSGDDNRDECAADVRRLDGQVVDCLLSRILERALYSEPN